MNSFEARHEHLAAQSLFDFFSIRTLKEQFHRFLQVGGSLFHGCPLASDVKLGAKGDIEIAFLLQNGRIAALWHARFPLLQIERDKHRPHRSLCIHLVLGKVIAVNPYLLTVDGQIPVLLGFVQRM